MPAKYVHANLGAHTDRLAIARLHTIQHGSSSYRQVADHPVRNNRLSEFSSAYRSGRSTETALLKFFSHLVDALDKDALLSLIDLSTAFGTVHHDILLRRLCVSFRFEGTVLNGFRSYLDDRTQSVCLDSKSTEPRRVTCEVSRGLVLGPILCTLYTSAILFVHASFYIAAMPTTYMCWDGVNLIRLTLLTEFSLSLLLRHF